MTTALEGSFVEIEPLQAEFRIAILYETRELGFAAAKVCQRLMERFKGAFEFRLAAESFEALDQQKEFTDLLRAAEGANVIFIASAGGIPASLLRWLKRCIDGRCDDSPMALVDISDDEQPNASRVHGLLREIAEANHLDLISKEQIAVPSVRAFEYEHTGYFRYEGINE